MNEHSLDRSLSAQQVLNDVRGFSGARPLDDDATVIVVKRRS
jgi:serine phosphatase RsbU (regulator of sigma subunit)